MIDFLLNLLFSAGSYLGVILIVLFFLSSALKVIPEYQRGVIFRLGRMIGAKGPGLIIVIPFVDRVTRVDLRVFTLDVPVQEVITKDNVPIRVNAVVYFRVLEPTRSIVEVENYAVATSLLSQTTLRAVLGRSELDGILTAREQINLELQQIIDEKTDPWGIKVSAVEVKELELPDGMKRAMASQAEAERERRAKIIAAEGELQASERLSQAAIVMERSPITLQLRYLQTLRDVAGENNSTTIFPIPMDMLKPFLKRLTKDEKDED